jgi:hypothetical protein
MRLGLLLLNTHRFDPSEQPILRAVRQIATENPQHTFYWFLLSDCPIVSSDYPSNLIPIQLDWKRYNRWGSLFFLKLKVASLIRRFNIDKLLVDTPAVSGFSIPSIYYLEQPLSSDKRRQQKSHLAKAAKIISTSPSCCEDLHQLLPDRSDNIHHIPPDLRSCMRTVCQTNMETVEPYWLYLGWHAKAEPYLMLLKAFSIFKKWTHSGINLRFLYPPTPLIDHLSTYKFRNDVWLPVEDQPSDNIREHSFALLDFSNESSVHQSVFYAIQHNKPLLIPELETYQRLYGQGVFYAQTTAEQIGKQLIQLYKDETTVAEKKEVLHQQTQTWNHEVLGRVLLTE